MEASSGIRCYYAPENIPGMEMQHPGTLCNLVVSAVVTHYSSRNEQGKIFLCKYHYNIWKQNSIMWHNREQEII